MTSRFAELYADELARLPACTAGPLSVGGPDVTVIIEISDHVVSEIPSHYVTTAHMGRTTRTQTHIHIMYAHA